MSIRTHTSLFDTHSDAIAAVRDLEATGFTNEEIRIVGNYADMATGAGGLLGLLTEGGVDEKDAHVHAEGIRRGGTIVTVRTDATRVSHAANILTRHMPVNIASREAEYRKAGWNGYNGGGDVMFPTQPADQPREAGSRQTGCLPPGRAILSPGGY
ncbi:hypothetical protein ACQW02_07090 [Humitalea sp. 24SJ18S-53]|uniref:hypothetical protein n=1 Tax=Humitalea sp. 24SJ18S-53 TaxID=3422307 RepID=UPI003D67D2CA